MQANIGMAGEFRCVVKRADGSTKIDTGYQKNLILNQGLDFFGGNNGADMMLHCVIGRGNSQPVYTQNKLDAVITATTGGDLANQKYDYDATRDGNLYKTNKTRYYSFTGLNNVNISEIGLASSFDSTSNYYLCTRALIKDAQGNPTTITVLSGEELTVYYKLWAVFDTTDKVGTINLLDGVGGSVAYNYVARLAVVGAQRYKTIGLALKSLFNDISYSSQLLTGDIVDIKNVPTGSIFSKDSFSSKSEYSVGTYRQVLTQNLTTSEGNGTFRTYLIGTTFGAYQIRFGKVSDNSPITKTSSTTLSIPIEFSWGRYEGAL